MTMILEAKQVCHLANICPYNDPYGKCYGCHSNRQFRFECEYVVNNQIIKDAGIRLLLDQTGKMKVIME
ncbi:MAG TPA: hypothetical protein VMX17_08420 [Candidatus Glassbacteria bacterium]|nr:hypothetical protein [Candidatus Glassbacteria bacterium]